MELFESILDHIRGGVILCNYSTKKGSSEVVYLNRGWAEITGYTQEELEAEAQGNPQSLILLEDKEETDAKYAKQMLCGNTYELMYRIIHKSGVIRWVIDKGIVTHLEDGRVQNQSIITEVTAIKDREEHMRLLAQIDQLTDLNNKATFTFLAEALLDRQQKRQHALLLLDIDNFKGFNDNYGHAFGDKVLEAVALQMKEHFRSRDLLGRIGGDEFLILMIDVPDSEKMKSKAEELRLAISGINISGVHHAPITVSIGGAIFNSDKTYDTLFNEADAALYTAKKAGKNQYIQENA